MTDLASHETRVGPLEIALRGLLRNATVRVLALALTRIQPGWSDTWGTDPGSGFWRIYRNDRRMRLRHAGGELLQLAGWVAVIPPLADFRPRIARPTSHAFLHFEMPDLPAGLLERHCTQPLLYAADTDLGRLFTSLMEHLAAQTSVTVDLPFLAQTVSHLACALSLRRLDADAAQQVARALRGRNPISPALAMIHEDLASPASLDELAAVCGMSRRSFSERFRRWTGCSAWQYQLRERLVHAAELLASSDGSIDAVAVRCGFSDRYHLSKAFRRQHGQSPAAYRRRLQERRRREHGEAGG